MTDPADPWERIRHRTVDELITEVKLVRGSGCTLFGNTTPEGWPFALFLGIGNSQSGELAISLVEQMDRELEEHARTWTERAHNPELSPPPDSGLTHQMVGSLRWIAQTVHQAHHDGELAACPKATCSHIRALLGLE